MLNPFSVEKESNPTRFDFLPNKIPYPDFTREANYDAFPKENSNSFLFEDKLNNDSNEIKLEDNSFQNGRIDSKESTETIFDFSLQKDLKIVFLVFYRRIIQTTYTDVMLEVKTLEKKVII